MSCADSPMPKLIFEWVDKRQKVNKEGGLVLLFIEMKIIERSHLSTSISDTRPNLSTGSLELSLIYSSWSHVCNRSLEVYSLLGESLTWFGWPTRVSNIFSCGLVTGEVLWKGLSIVSRERLLGGHSTIFAWLFNYF